MLLNLKSRVTFVFKSMSRDQFILLEVLQSFFSLKMLHNIYSTVIFFQYYCLGREEFNILDFLSLFIIYISLNLQSTVIFMSKILD